MQIVIEIPSVAYKACLKMKSDNDDGLLGFCLINAVANGKTTEQPAAEPEVIRCRDCKYHVGEGCCDYWGEGRMFLDISDSDFCSRAERKTE